MRPASCALRTRTSKRRRGVRGDRARHERTKPRRAPGRPPTEPHRTDRKSTRLNSSHGYISYAVFCLKKKKTDLITLLNRTQIILTLSESRLLNLRLRLVPC